MTFGAGLSFDGSWTLTGGPQSASITATASFNASLKAAITAPQHETWRLVCSTQVCRRVS